MDHFKPVITQTSNFVDPLTAGLQSDEEDCSFIHSIKKNHPITKDTDSHPNNEVNSTIPVSVVSKPQSIMKPELNHRAERSVSCVEPIITTGQSYEAEWNKICQSAFVTLENLISLAVTGQLRVCRFRSICWSLFLNVLPSDSLKWLSIFREKRKEYENLRLQLIVTPGNCDETLDPTVDNPLSQDEQSPWNQYFEDHELKKLIRLDVNRTFPEVPFFQSQWIQDMMVTILFVFARQHPKTSYVQGMHEVLAPLIFILHCDHQSHAHARDMSSTPSMLQEIMDETYIEHDSYGLLSAVMSGLHHWYEEGSGSHLRPTPRTSIIEAQPFARPQDIGPTSFIVQKLTSIHDDLLQEYEPDIYLHLGRMEIPPQVYGIRWARLMFGREFAITDLLLVWDAIFATGGEDFTLLQYMMIAMLSYVKDELLNADYITTLNLLMRYPQSADAQVIIRMALHYHNPKANLRPARYSLPLRSQESIHHSAVTHSQFRISGNTHSPVATISRSASLPRSKVTTRTNPAPHRPSSARHRSRNKSDSSMQAPSPTTTVEDPLNVVSFSKHRLSDSESDSEEEKSTTTNTNKNRVITSISKLGEKLARPKDLAVPKSLPQQGSTNILGPKEAGECKSQPMKFMETKPRFVEGSLLNDENRDSISRGSSSDGSDMVSMSHEEVVKLCLECTVKLCHHKATLATRHAELNVESDKTVALAMQGITQVINSLRKIQDNTNRKTSIEKQIYSCHIPAIPVNHPLAED